MTTPDPAGPTHKSAAWWSKPGLTPGRSMTGTFSPFDPGRALMVLNGQQFSEVVSYLRDKVAASMAGSEKRRTSRMDLKSRIVLIPLRKGASAERITVLTR